MTVHSTIPKINGWKWGFLFLLAANLAFLTVVLGRLIEVREPATSQVIKRADQAVKIGSFETNREQLNQTIQDYLKAYQTKTLSYSVVVGKTTVLFEGTYHFLGYQVPLYIYFAPSQLEDGRLRLDITDFSVGTLSLPAQDVLIYLKKSYNLPQFVTIQPETGSIMIDLTKLDNKAGIYLKARQIDLLNDHISLDIYRK